MVKKILTLSKAIKTLNPDMSPEITTAFEGAFEGLAGIVKSSPRDLAISWLNIAQRVIRGQKLASVSAEFEALKKKGKISSGYLSSLQGQYTLTELLDFLENHQVDEQVFQVMKKIFLVAATKKEEVIAQQYMRIAKDLTGGEVIVLTTAFRISTDPKLSEFKFGSGSIPEGDWGQVIANQSGLKHSELVLSHAESLTKKRMLYPQQQAGSMNVYMGNNMRLTDLSYGFCVYISKYDELLT